MSGTNGTYRVFQDGDLSSGGKKELKLLAYSPEWPESWKLSHRYDLLELCMNGEQRGYRYAYQERRNATLTAIQAVAPPGATILDVAAAQGNFSLALAELGYRVTWNDLRGDLVEYVRSKWEFGSIDFLPGNLFELPAEKRFEVVLATEIIEHVAHPDRFLLSLAERLVEGGHLVLTTPNGCYFRNTLPKFSECEDPSQYEKVQFQPNSDGHIFLLHPDELCALGTRAGLAPVTLRFFNNPLTSGHVKLGKVLPMMPHTLVRLVEGATQRAPEWLKRRMNAGMLAIFKKS